MSAYFTSGEFWAGVAAGFVCLYVGSKLGVSVFSYVLADKWRRQGISEEAIAERLRVPTFADQVRGTWGWP